MTWWQFLISLTSTCISFMDENWMEGPSSFLVLNEVPSTIWNEIEVGKNKVINPKFNLAPVFCVIPTKMKRFFIWGNCHVNHLGIRILLLRHYKNSIDSGDEILGKADLYYTFQGSVKISYVIQKNLTAFWHQLSIYSYSIFLLLSKFDPVII